MTAIAVPKGNDWLLTDCEGEEILLSEVKNGDQLNRLYEFVEEGETTSRELLTALYDLAVEFGDYDAASMWFTIGGFVDVFTPEQQSEINDIGGQWLRGSEVRDAFEAR